MEVKLLRIIVASPGDVRAERDALTEVVAELNQGIALDRGLHLELIRWETDVYPGFHPDGPQGLIDAMLRIEDSDILIGIFWKRFGTPTKDATSGTEHEIRKAYAAWQKQHRPQIMVYFNQTPDTPKSKMETDPWGQVLAFKSAFPKEGLWWDYNGPKAFGKLVRKHLTHHIRRQYKLTLSSQPEKPTLPEKNTLANDPARTREVAVPFEAEDGPLKPVRLNPHPRHPLADIPESTPSARTATSAHERTLIELGKTLDGIFNRDPRLRSLAMRDVKPVSSVHDLPPLELLDVANTVAFYMPPEEQLAIKQMVLLLEGKER